jgi:hypothetical protein
MARHLISRVAPFLMIVAIAAVPAHADVLRVMRIGLGSGTVTGTGINCGADCDETHGAVAVTLTAVASPGSVFSGWGGDCTGAAATCTVSMSVARSVRADFALTTPIPALADFTPGGINTYLTANPVVTTAARFLKALPQDFKQNWILMGRSESLQTGIADSPRILLPNNNAQRVFTIGMNTHDSYPGADPRAIEYMQWDAAQKNFRFHEIVLDAIPAMNPIPGTMPPAYRIPARSRGVSLDDSKCFACHSTRNVLNRGTTPGTDGIPAGTVKVKTKPNWDTYDSWGGMTPFNRDRIYQGSAEAAAFRTLLNLWTWRSNDAARAIIEQLELQPPGVPAAHAITRTTGGVNDGHINFNFDVSPPVLTEPPITGSVAPITTAYSFDGVAGTGTPTTVLRQGTFLTLHDSVVPTSDEGRGVQLFDLLGGFDGQINPLRIADELITHRFATGSVPIDVRAIALAITQRCITVAGGTNLGDTQTVNAPGLSGSLAFFDARHGISSFDQLWDDTRLRATSLPRRKADIQRIAFDRTIDPYAYDSNLAAPPPPPGIINGLIQQYGSATSAGPSTTLERLRQEVFRRSIDNPGPDSTVMGGIYVDREEYTNNTDFVALYRYFLEPLGVSVDKWSMGVRGRSRTYTFADVFGFYTSTFATELKGSLGISLSAMPSAVCSTVMPMVNTMIGSLPPANAVPKYTDVQRIFNKGCIECHGGLGYPPYSTYGTSLDFSEDENPPAGDRRMTRSHGMAMAYTSAPISGTDVSNSYLYSRITNGGSLAMPYDPVGTNEGCPSGLMPCGGPPLSKVDIETIRRWIVGGRPFTEGDPHIKTVDGVNYDFQSAGEFVLLRGEDLEIQARQAAVTTAGPLGPNGHTGLSSCVSVNTAVALRVGRHRVSYQPEIRPSAVERGANAPTRLVLRVDGKVAEMTGREIPFPSGGRIVRTTADGGIQVEYPGGTVVIVTPAWWTTHQIWYMNINVHHSRATEGVMGAIAPGNWLPALPDGSFMGPQPASLHQRYLDLYEQFADAWRVAAATSLFDYEAGLSTADFTIDSWPIESPTSCTAPPQPGVPPVTTVLSPLPQAEAEQICGAIAASDRKANCVQDVMATGERAFAETYTVTERIDNRPTPPAPTLESPADNAELSAGSKFTWNRLPLFDRKRLSYRHCIWSAAQLYDLNKCTAIADDYADRRARMSGVAAFIALVLFLIVFVTRLKYRRLLLGVVTIAVLTAVIGAVYFSRTTTAVSATARQLGPGKVYFWKVVAEDGEGATIESPTRRFTVR